MHLIWVCQYKHMESTIQILIKKYPQLAYFDLQTALTPQELALLQTQIDRPYKSMSPECKAAYKSFKKYADIAKRKFKNGKRLYKAIENEHQFIDQIILNHAQLRSIEALERRNLEHLNELQLNSNQIKSISPLKRIKTPHLQEIDLSSNQIDNLKPLQSVAWPKLRILNLSQNNIVSLQGLPLHSFTCVKTVNFSDNFISQLRCLRKALTPELTSLKQLNLSNNQIVDISWLCESYFHKLEKLNLRNNRYPSFLCLQKIKMAASEKSSTRLCIAQYEVCLSSIGRHSNYILNYRYLSRHKQSAKIEAYQPRSNRQDIQKSRRLKLH